MYKSSDNESVATLIKNSNNRDHPFRLVFKILNYSNLKKS